MKNALKCVRCDAEHSWNVNIIYSDLPILEKVKDALCGSCMPEILKDPDYREIYNLYADMFKVNS
jgi:hypothetical protein